MRRLFPLAVVGAVLWLGLASCGRRFHLKAPDISSEGNYACSRGSGAQLGSMPSRGFDGRLNRLWQRGFSGKPAGPLAVQNGSLVLADSKKKLRFYDVETGHHRGRLKAKGVPQTGVAVADSLAFYAVAPRRNFVQAYNLLTGKRLWRNLVKDANPGPIIQGDRLIVSSSEGFLFAFGLADGKPAWETRFDCRLTASASYAEGMLYQPGDGGMLLGLSAEDGRELFRTDLEGSLVSPVAAADRVYATDVSGNVYAIDPHDGAIVWRTRLDGPIWTSPAVAGDRLYVGHSGGEVVALSGTDGEVIWRYDVGTVVRASLLVIGDRVIAGTMAGKLMVLDAVDGALIDSTTVKGAIEFPPVTDGRRLFVATQAGKIICFGETDEQTDRTDHGVPPQRQSE